jgi:hypothetical protein
MMANLRSRRRSGSRRRAGVVALLLLAGERAAAAEDVAVQDQAAVQDTAQSLPAIAVTADDPPARAPAKRSKPARSAASRGAARATAPGPQTPATGDAASAAQAVLDRRMAGFDHARDQLQPKAGATATTIDRAAIEAMPQGANAPLDRLVLAFPGVNTDSAASGQNFHVRGEYSNVQTRINGLVVPEGISSLGPMIDTSFIGSLSLLTGALPAQYGLRTAGVLDITSRAFSTPAGSLSVYGGSHQTITPSFDYGGGIGDTQYFFAGRGNWNSLGIENPTSSIDALHDHTDQGKFFAYVSTLLSDSARLSIMSGAAYSHYQIPNNPGQTPLGNFGPLSYDASSLNETQQDRYQFNMVALQTKGDTVDAQLSVFQRWAQVHFIPDVFGDLVFNDIASDVTRSSEVYGSQFDAAWRINDAHTLRGGFLASAEKTNVASVATVLPVDPASGAIAPAPFTVTDANALLGWTIGTYLQDEWKLTNALTLTWGLRFDQIWQYVDAGQFSPRAALVYKPFDGTALHAGYARTFTPPMQALAGQANLALFAGTTGQPTVPLHDPVLPERAHYFDVGIDQKLLPGLEVGLDAYTKIATDLLDDGQFGQTLLFTQFNFARGYSEGIEGKVKYTSGDFTARGSLAFNITRAIDPVSNQYLLDAAEYAYLLTHYHNTDDMQTWTGSAGASYRWSDTVFSVDMKYGSGLPSGFANSAFNQPYFTANIGIAHDFTAAPGAKPLTARFDVVNLFDKIYEIHDGSGIGVFAPQYGARRGYFAGLSQKL